jgi:hypothetical protein
MAIDSGITTSLLAMTSSYTVTRGQAASVQLSFHSLPPGAVTSADCYNLPVGVNCSYSTQTEILGLTTGVNTPPGTYQILVVSTVNNPKTTASVSEHSGEGRLWCGLLGLPLGVMWFGRKRRRWLYSGVGILSVCLVLMAGCSSGTTITSSSGTSQASTTLTLTVN